MALEASAVKRYTGGPATRRGQPDKYTFSCYVPPQVTILCLPRKYQPVAALYTQDDVSLICYVTSSISCV